MVDDIIGGLERRLASNPRDADGWVLLMRSRMVMGQPDRARAALSNSLEAFQGDRDTQQRLRAVAAELDVPSGG
jgi:cytochrome c-type biogenesis protein CcmH